MKIRTGLTYGELEKAKEAECERRERLIRDGGLKPVREWKVRKATDAEKARFNPWEEEVEW